MSKSNLVDNLPKGAAERRVGSQAVSGSRFLVSHKDKRRWVLHYKNPVFKRIFLLVSFLFFLFFRCTISEK